MWRPGEAPKVHSAVGARLDCKSTVDNDKKGMTEKET